MEQKPSTEEPMAPIFIETDELANLIETLPAEKLKILDCTLHSAPEDGDPLLVHHKAHIPR